METIQARCVHRRRVASYLLLLMVLFMQQQWLQAQAPPPAHSLVIQKALTSKKYKIKLFANANREVLFFQANGAAGKVYQFYLFDMEGKLVKQAQIRNKETTMLANFSKGDYMFEVFSDDERIENGTIAIR
jgi:hypothetical protein